MPRKPRPTTPSMMLGPLGSPDSPPQTPTSTAPVVNGKYATRHLPTWHHPSHSPLLEDSSIQPTGNLYEFSFTPSNRFAQLSPRTSSEDSESDEDEEHSESESESASEGGEAMQAISNHEENDEEGEDDEDSEDEEEEEEDDDDEPTDVDDDVPMNLHPQAPAPMHAPTFIPGPAPMAVDGSSEEESDEESDEEEDDSESEDESAVTPPTQETFHESHAAASTAAAVATAPKANFTLEELSDFDPMDQDRTGTIAPSGFSSPASARSRSRSQAPAPKELPPGLTRKMRDLNCGLSSSSDGDSEEDLDEDEAAHREFVRMQRELRMRKRRSHGSSIGKRTISERSDSDHEDWTPLDPDAVGSSARRLRRRVGDRRSFIHLQFQDPPPPRIDELDEPESEVEGTFIFCDSGTLAQELPYYSIEIMEYSTPSP
ncbi:hypothetical protein CTA2_7498 [Colletotrichum tanaceti]|uniref:Uncharacterized protein n=1 Tax=Colletotrichum tanaceti TaxID=1306861 RepID=A0A4U6X229_9PEZI|nr:hypothetical protein CTA2_7498 [Colletotrichum tanaceti]TKW49054.1 hypothetical protein CTA1_1925 [Colletotrichum tanaceti]